VAILQTKNWPEKEAWRSDIMDAINLLAEDKPPFHQPTALSKSVVRREVQGRGRNKVHY
jgi:hypothetical protein